MMLRSLLIAGLSGLMLVIVIAGLVTGNTSVAVIGFFWFVLIALVFVFAPGSAWRRNPVVQGAQRHSFDDDGLTCRSAAGPPGSSGATSPRW